VDVLDAVAVVVSVSIAEGVAVCVLVGVIVAVGVVVGFWVVVGVLVVVGVTVPRTVNVASALSVPSDAVIVTVADDKSGTVTAQPLKLPLASVAQPFVSALIRLAPDDAAGGTLALNEIGNFAPKPVPDALTVPPTTCEVGCN
jgi:hypothetical protein